MKNMKWLIISLYNDDIFVSAFYSKHIRYDNLMTDCVAIRFCVRAFYA